MGIKNIPVSASQELSNAHILHIKPIVEKNQHAFSCETNIFQSYFSFCFMLPTKDIDKAVSFV